jgi:hypothetical protein
LQAAVLFSAIKRIFFTDASRGTKNICFTNASNLIGVFNTVVPSRFPRHLRFKLDLFLFLQGHHTLYRYEECLFLFCVGPRNEHVLIQTEPFTYFNNNSRIDKSINSSYN